MQYIQSVSELEQYKHWFYGQPILGVDTETLGFDPHTVPMRLLQLSNGSKTVAIDVFKVGTKAIKEHVGPVLEDKAVVKVLHNAKFDCKFIKKQLNVDVERIFDTMLASILIEAGVVPKDENGKKIKGYHGLGSTVKRYLNRDVDKSLQTSDWSGELSQAQLEYAATDVEVLPALREEMLKFLKKFGLIRCAKIEFEAVLPIAWLELCGFYLNFNQWVKVANHNGEQAKKLGAEIYEELTYLLPQGNLFGEVNLNLDSVAQVKKIFEKHGVPMPASSKEFELTPLTAEYPIVQKLLDYRGYTKACGSFGENWSEHINPVTGRIHSDFMQIGAATGRLASSNPNLSQIPKDKEHRGCFQAQDGNTLISADFSQEELRLLADFSRDPKFLEVFAKGGDFHKHTAALIYNIPLDKVDADARDMAKRMNFGVVYGIGAWRFAKTANILETEARMIINKYFDTFKGVKRWLNFQKVQVVENHYNRTPSGRLVRYEFDEDDGEARAAAQREGANLPLQGGGADILKRSLRIFYDESKSFQNKIKLVNLVHDQIDIESPIDIANEVEDLLNRCMVKAGTEFVSQVEIKVDSHQKLIWEKD
jgi:DNA polymerase-1